ncbi:hypothetical protein PoB_003323600 [Plakobranchus ocellatus]|uniref:Uncharacterized protein n=1 Tax=Plakobranchus ocellatus TaxID=259542 RepID=A0AAV4A686_9GAST|nr:hypothetical protein PoB_003323600 [Plakobranchus ocellatus]
MRLKTGRKVKGFGFFYFYTASPQQTDFRLSGPPSGRGAGGGARTHNRRVPADPRTDSLATVPPSPRKARGTLPWSAAYQEHSGPSSCCSGAWIKRGTHSTFSVFDMNVAALYSVAFFIYYQIQNLIISDFLLLEPSRTKTTPVNLRQGQHHPLECRSEPCRLAVLDRSSIRHTVAVTLPDSPGIGSLETDRTT